VADCCIEAVLGGEGNAKARYKIALFNSLRVFKLRVTNLSKKRGTALLTLLHIKKF